MDRYMLFPSGMGQHQNGSYVLFADAQATIAALQARVKECDAVIEKQVAILEEINKLDAERAAFVVDLKAQLTQRTAERDTARRRVDELEAREVDVVTLREDLEQRTAELERVRLLSSHNERRFEEVDKKYKGLHSLIKALPKVEGEIAVKETEIDLAVMWGITVNGLFGEHSPLFDTKEEADAYAALLQHRQGMEG